MKIKDFFTYISIGVLISCTSAQKEKKNRTKLCSENCVSAVIKQQQRESERAINTTSPAWHSMLHRRQTAPQVCGMIFMLTGVCARFNFHLVRYTHRVIQTHCYWYIAYSLDMYIKQRHMNEWWRTFIWG